MMYETYGTASAFLLFGLVKGVFPVANVRAMIRDSNLWNHSIKKS